MTTIGLDYDDDDSSNHAGSALVAVHMPPTATVGLSVMLGHAEGMGQATQASQATDANIPLYALCKPTYGKTAWRKAIVSRSGRSRAH